MRDDGKQIWLSIPDARSKFQKKRVSVRYRLPTGVESTAIGELWVYKKPRQALYAIDIVCDYCVYPKIIRHLFHLTADQISKLTAVPTTTYDYLLDKILTHTLVKQQP